MPPSGLDTTDVPRGVTAALTVPNGGSTFVCAYRSAVSTTGFAGYYCNLANFGPIAAGKGGSIRGAMKRYSSAANYAPMMGFILGTDPTSNNGYMIGLSEATGYNICLKKGTPASGLDAAGSDILRASTDAYTTVGDSATGWFHLRLDMIVNPHNEVVFNLYANDLTSNAVTAPVWAAIDGMDQYIDDSVGVLTGSLPYTGPFYAFFGMYTEAAGSTVAFDHIEVHRQTSP